MMSANCPALLIAGIQKAGTTSLFEALGEIDGVYGSALKEPAFFCQVKRVRRSHEAWYEGLFPDSIQGTRLEASTCLVASEEALAAAADYYNEARFVVIFRDPVDRAYSGYWQLRKWIPPVENRNFAEIVHGVSSAVERHGCGIPEAEERELRSAARRGSVDLSLTDESFHEELYGASLNTEFIDPLWPYRYFGQSCYNRVIRRLNKTGVAWLPVIFEELVDDPKSTIQRICKFAEIPPAAAAVDLPDTHETAVPYEVARGILTWWVERGQTLLSSLPLKLKETAIWRAARKLWRVSTRRGKPTLRAGEREAAAELLSGEYEAVFEECPRAAKRWSR